MKEKIKVITDPEVFKVCLEGNRCEIMSILKEGDMSVNEMAATLVKDYSTIFRHVKKLEKHGFLIKKGLSRRKRAAEIIYGRTADIFLPMIHCRETESIAENSIIWKKEQAHEVVKTLEKMGYKNNGHKELAQDIYDLFQCYTKIVNDKMKDAGFDPGDMTFFNLMRIRFMVFLLEMELNHELEKHICKLKTNIECDKI